MRSSLSEMVGKRYGRLTVADIVSPAVGAKKRCVCRCDCGNIVEVIPYELKRKDRPTQSCGCLYRESRRTIGKTHGLSKTRLYTLWNSMLGRCFRPTDSNYKKYGAKGVSVCEEWKQFLPFYEWAMANGYRDDLTIDRIDNDGDYSPENCRWATQRTQQNNRKNNRRIEMNGESHTCAEWARILNISPSTLSYRLNVARLDSVEALTKEVKT